MGACPTLPVVVVAAAAASPDRLPSTNSAQRTVYTVVRLNKNT